MEGKPTYIKINEFIKSFDIRSRESPEELRARLENERADAAHRRRKDFALFVIVAAMVCVVACACLWISLRPSYPADLKGTAFSLLTVIVSASMGYLTGKNSQ